MKKFEYCAKMQSTQHVIDNLNQLIEELNDLHGRMSTYIEEITCQILDDRMRYDIDRHYNEFISQYHQLQTLVSDRLLLMKDDMISKMIIIPEGYNIKGIIMEYNSDLSQELNEMEGQLHFLESNLHSS